MTGRWGTPHERFLGMVDKTDDCWLWTGGTTPDGYGRLRGGVEHGRRTIAAHRFSYEHYVGPIPAGFQIDHLCRVPSCVNPEHLEPVTSRENTMRGQTLAAAQAAQTHCKHGHPFDEENTYMKSNGARFCRACGREASRRYLAKKAA